MTDEEFFEIVRRDAPGLRLGAGRWSNGVPCPKCGGRDRFQFSRATGKYRARVFCRQCLQQGADAEHYMMWMHGMTREEYFQKHGRVEAAPWRIAETARMLPRMHIVLHWHKQLGRRIEYFRGRGISDEMAKSALLGWNSQWNRYAIPCIENGVLMAIQYRARGNETPKYVSERGGINKCLYNPTEKRGAYILVVEGPLDALALTSIGFPTVAPFQGNNTRRAWERAWNKRLKSESVIIVADNDPSGTGDLIAISKLNEIGRGRIVHPPDGFKDAGEVIQADLATAKERVSQWLGIPPLD